MHRSWMLCATLLLAGSEFAGSEFAGVVRSEVARSPQAAKARLLWRFPGYGYVQYQHGAGQPGGTRSTRLTAGFYSHELKSSRQVRFSRYALADLLPMLALSLSGHTPRQGAVSKISLRMEDCVDAGAVSIKGTIKTRGVAKASRIEQAGHLRIRGTEKPKSGQAAAPGGRPARRPKRGMGEKKFIHEAVISFERVVDAMNGRVLSFAGKIQGSYITHKGAEPREFAIEESWRFKAIHRPDTPAFRKLVNDAIESGQDWLARNNRGNLGQQALALLTLCKNNPDRDSDAIQGLLEELRESQPRRTYELAVSIQALEAIYELPNESARLRRGEISEPAKRRIPLEDLDLMAQWLKRLLANRSKSGGNRWRFHYVSDASFDNSNTQFAALGLQAAQRCGLKVPKEAWTGLAQHFLRERLDGSREKTRIRLTTYRDLARRKKTGKKSSVTSTRGAEVKVKGFNYHKAEPTSAGGRRMRIRPIRQQKAYGSMTCAGVTGLTIALGALGNQKPKDGRLLGKLNAARTEGFAWLLANYDVRRNPGKDLTWYFYYLYSLERTCELGGVARIQDKNWYFDGAMQILTLQNTNGSFRSSLEAKGPLIDSCFAILFLKRAIAPVTTR